MTTRIAITSSLFLGLAMLLIPSAAGPCRLRRFISLTALVPKPVTAALPVAMAGIGTMATGIGATATAAIGTTAITMAIGPTATMAIGATATATGTGRTVIGPTAMESLVELLAAISAEESPGSEHD